MELHGVTGPIYKHPNVRKLLPAPFTRSRIDLDGGQHVKRAWQEISVAKVKEGDTVAGFGRVAHVIEFTNIPAKFAIATSGGESEYVAPDPDQPFWRIRLHNVMNDYQDFPGEQRVLVFAPEPVTNE